MADQFFRTSDGVRLRYKASGKGEAIVILNGFGQDANDFDVSRPALEAHFTVYTLDYRGHGLSDTPSHGYHIERLAKDFHDFVLHCGFERFHLVAHSMGNAVFWSYLMMFGQERIGKYVLVDEAPCLMCDPAWTKAERETYCGFYQLNDVWNIPYDKPPESETDKRSPDRLVRKERQAVLLRDHLGRDWRDVVGLIAVPTLVLMGGASPFASPLLWKWLNETIPGSVLKTIDAADGGTHDMHIRSGGKFDEIVIGFLNGR